MSTKVIIKGFKEFKEQQINLIKDLSERQIQECAEETARVMQFHIQTSIERDGSTGNLANNIYASKLIEGWGVGDIDNLNEKAPYWTWINYGVAQSGRKIPPGTLENPAIKGHFTSPAQGRFVKGQPNFFMNPTKPITPHNFIEKSVQQIPSIVNAILAKIRRLS